MEDKIFETVSQYVFGGLFVALLFYVLKTNSKREDRLMRHNEKLQDAFQETAQTMKLMKNEIAKDLKDIKEMLKER